MTPQLLKMTPLSKFITVYLLFAGLLLSVSGQDFTENKFVNMPEDILPSLSAKNRLELIEFYKAGQSDEVTKNLFNDTVKVIDYDSVNNYLNIKVADNSTFEMKMFPTENVKDTTSYIIGVINSVCAPICSSYITFYDKDWKKIETGCPIVTASDWLKNKDAQEDDIKIADMFKGSFITYQFDKNKNQILLHNNSLEFLTDEDKLMAKPYLKDKDKICKISFKNKAIEFKLQD